MELTVAVPIDAPAPVVWDVLTDWERQADWMVDARAVHVLTPDRAGPGVTIRVPTVLLGVVVQDVLRVTRWEPPRLLEVVHLGRVIRGRGVFHLADDPVTGGTTLTWREWIDPPLGALGRWGAATVVRPVVERLFHRSLGNVARLAERAAVPWV